MNFNMKKIVLVSFVLLCCPGFLLAADENDDLRDQLNELKDEIIILQDQLEETSVASANRMSISGYSDIEYHDSTKGDSEPGFRLHHMSLFFEKRVTEQWKFFSEIEYEDAPYLEFDHTADDADSECEGCYGKIFLEAVNFTYSNSPLTNVRAGRFFTPAGIWSIDHYPPFVPTQLRPEHVRNIFPQVVDGIDIFGTLSMGNTFVNYDLYFGNGEGNPGKKDTNSDKAVGFKVSLLLPLFKYFELGFSGYNDTSTDLTNVDSDKKAVGAHVKIKFASFTLQSEYAKAEIEPGNAPSYDKIGHYGQLLYDLGNWTFGVRRDFFDENDSAEVDLTFNGIFVNYHVTPAILLKLEHHQVEVEDAAVDDYDHTIASVVMYLGN